MYRGGKNVTRLVEFFENTFGNVSWQSVIRITPTFVTVKLKTSILRMARTEVDKHLLPDLHYTTAFRGFMKDTLDAETYMAHEFGFKKFIYVYGIGRTLGAGDECKMKILQVIRNFPFAKSHIDTIITLSETLRDLCLSSNASKGGNGLPRSFCSKLLYVYKPDEIIPYDSYVLRSLASHFGEPIKDLHQYYDRANDFRQTYFPEHGAEVRRLRNKHDAQHLAQMKSLRVDADMLFSWKLADKYLWCAEEVKRNI